MSAQLELDMTRPAPAETPLVRTRKRTLLLARGALLWTPVWAPLVFLGQLVLLGFLPARAEEQRIDAAEREVRARADGLEQEERELAREERMLSDSVFQERMRRSLVDPKTEPLTLERARAGSRP